MSLAPSVRLKVTEALARDAGRAFVRLDPADMGRLGVASGDLVTVRGRRQSFGKVMPLYPELRGQGRLQLDGTSRTNAGCALDEEVEITPATAAAALEIRLAPIDLEPQDRDLPYIGSLLDGLPVQSGDRLRVNLFGSRSAEFRVTDTRPGGAVLIHPATQLSIDKKRAEEAPRGPSYEDVGGLKRELRRIREMIELPLRFPELFARLGIDPPTGVLLHGAPGCGKTLIARAIAHESAARFFSINGPEIIQKHYGESEAQLRRIFEQALAARPSILFIDELDAIAPRRDKVLGDVEKRVVAQLLTLMDGLSGRRGVVVIAATNLPDQLDPALRRPGRFDREIVIPVPDRDGRLEILEVHTRGMPLAADVDLPLLASRTHGFVGADLAALAREAAMSCLGRLLPELDLAAASLPPARLEGLTVTLADFLAAFREVTPSALREVFVEVPEVRFDDVGGLEAIKQLLVENVVWPLQHAERFRAAGVRPAKGVLIAGPPGCGKTLLAKAVACESGVNFLSVKGPELLSKYVGESEAALAETFRKARSAAPAVIFFDEVDALLARRDAGAADSGVAARVLSQFLTEMDGIVELNGVLVLAATNRLDLLDPAAVRPGRFDAVIEIPLPDAAARRRIFEIHLADKPLTFALDGAALAARTEGWSGADIASACRVAALGALERAVATQNETVQLEPADLERALEREGERRRVLAGSPR
jgi:transitional endoplasmic reticulum ATPase